MKGVLVTSDGRGKGGCVACSSKSPMGGAVSVLLQGDEGGEGGQFSKVAR